MESILTTIKAMLGLAEDQTEFDAELIVHINSVFTTLAQLGVGPSKGFYIIDKADEWGDFMPSMDNIQAVKQYIFLKVRLVFDTASLGSATLAAYERSAKEYEWRLNVIAESNNE